MEETDMRNMLLSSKRICLRGHDTHITGRTKQRNCKVCISAHNKEWHKNNPEYKSPSELSNPQYYRERALITKYGINLKQYSSLSQKQNGKCAICGIKPASALSVDHDHKKGHIRSLLCGNCNRGLGVFFDKPRLLRKAANYLEQHGV